MKRILRDFKKAMTKESGRTYTEEDRDDLNEMQYEISLMMQNYIDKQEKCEPVMATMTANMN